MILYLAFLVLCLVLGFGISAAADPAHFLTVPYTAPPPCTLTPEEQAASLLARAEYERSEGLRRYYEAHPEEEDPRA
jgi:hypothetical protein